MARLKAKTKKKYQDSASIVERILALEQELFDAAIAMSAASENRIDRARFDLRCAAIAFADAAYEVNGGVS